MAFLVRKCAASLSKLLLRKCGTALLLRKCAAALSKLLLRECTAALLLRKCDSLLLLLECATALLLSALERSYYVSALRRSYYVSALRRSLNSAIRACALGSWGSWRLVQFREPRDEIRNRERMTERAREKNEEGGEK
jgi:hypothetical protein